MLEVRLNKVKGLTKVQEFPYVLTPILGWLEASYGALDESKSGHDQEDNNR